MCSNGIGLAQFIQAIQRRDEHLTGGSLEDAIVASVAERSREDLVSLMRQLGIPLNRKAREKNPIESLREVVKHGIVSHLAI